MEAYHSVYEAPQQEVEAYEAIVDFLASEGLVESYEEADELIEGMSDEEIYDILDEVRGFGGRIPKGGTDYAPPFKNDIAQTRNESPASTRGRKALQNFRRNSGAGIQAARNAAGVRSKSGGPYDRQQGPDRSRNPLETAPDAGKPSGISMSPDQRAKLAAERAERQGEGKRANKIRSIMSGVSESYDNYDLILSHLLDEGYADSEDAALQIMSNMSEDWLDQIVEKADNTIRLVYGKGGKGIPLNGHSGYFLRRPNVGFAQQGMNFRNATKDAHNRASASEREREEKNKANAARYDQALRSDIQRATNRSGDDKGLPSGRLRIDRRARNR